MCFFLLGNLFIFAISLLIFSMWSLLNEPSFVNFETLSIQDLNFIIIIIALQTVFM